MKRHQHGGTECWHERREDCPEVRHPEDDDEVIICHVPDDVIENGTDARCGLCSLEVELDRASGCWSHRLTDINGLPAAA